MSSPCSGGSELFMRVGNSRKAHSVGSSCEFTVSWLSVVKMSLSWVWCYLTPSLGSERKCFSCKNNLLVSHWFTLFQDDFPKRCSFNASLYAGCGGNYELIGLCADYPVYLNTPDRDRVLVRSFGGTWYCVSGYSDISDCYGGWFAKASEVRESPEGWWDFNESYAICRWNL